LTNNSPNRSSNATLDTTWLDIDQPAKNKDLFAVFPMTKRLSASTSLTVSVASDYNESFTAVTRADATAHNTANGIFSRLVAKSFVNKKAFKIRVAFTSSTSNSPQLQGVGLYIGIKDELATQ